MAPASLPVCVYNYVIELDPITRLQATSEGDVTVSSSYVFGGKATPNSVAGQTSMSEGVAGFLSSHLPLSLFT